MVLGELVDKYYGPTGRDTINQMLKEVIADSNCKEDFDDNKMVKIGWSFMCGKLAEVDRGEKKLPTIKALVCSSFGEAMMYKWNVCNGVIPDTP